MQVSISVVTLAALIALSLPVLAASPLQSAPPAAETELSAALSAFRRGDHRAARATFRTLAGQNVPAAETLLGTMAMKGQGGPQDAAVGAAWFMRAARRGYAPAQLALADSFAKGRGVAKNPARAMALGKAAAAQQHPGAALWVVQNSPPQLALAQR